MQLFVTLRIAAHQASLSIMNFWSLLSHIHRVGDAIQPSRPLLSPSPPAFNLSQHQGPFQGVSFFASSGQSIGASASASASVLPMNIQG